MEITTEFLEQEVKHAEAELNKAVQQVAFAKGHLNALHQLKVRAAAPEETESASR